MSVGKASGLNRLLSMNLNPFRVRKCFGRKWPEVDSGLSKTKTLPLEIVEAIYFAVFPGKNEAAIFRHSTLPASQH